MHLLALLLLGLPIASYWIHLFVFAANVPILDDYDVILDSTNRFLGASGLSRKVAVLWAQHNEHRLVVLRIVALIQYYLLGRINFRQLSFAGSLAWTAGFVLIVREHRKRAQLPLLFYVPLAYLWFSFVHRENTFWAMASLQNYGAMFLSIVALRCVLTGRIVATCLSCALGVLTSMICWPLFVVCIGITLARRAWRDAGALAGTAILLALLYFHRYTPTAGHPVFSIAVMDFEATLAYGLAVVGSEIRFAGYSITVGVFSVAAMLYFIFLRKTSPWSVALALLSLSQAAAIAVGRGGYGGDRYEAALVASRFTTVSMAAGVALYLLFQDATPDPRRAVRALLLSTLLAMTYGFAMTARTDIFADLSREYSERANGMAGYLPHSRITLYCDGPPERCEPILLRSKELGVFDYATAVGLGRKAEAHRGALGPSLGMTSQIDFYDGSRLQGWALIVGRMPTKCQTYLILSPYSERSYWIPTMKTRRPEASVSQHVQFDYDMAGFEAFPALFDIPVDDYRVGIAIATADGLALKWTGRSYRPTR